MAFLPQNASDKVEQQHLSQIQVAVRRHIQEYPVPVLQKNGLEDVAFAIIQNGYHFEVIRQQAAILHPALARIIRDNMAEWALGSKNRDDAWEAFKHELDTHVEEQLTHIVAAAQESYEALLKHLGCLQRLNQVLEEKASAHKDTIAAFFRVKSIDPGGKGWEGASVQEWISCATDSKQNAWGEIKQQLQEGAESPIGKMVNQLGKLHSALSQSPEKREKLEQELRANLGHNVQHAYQRAERELRGLTERVKNEFYGPLKAATTDFDAAKGDLKRLTRDWLDDSADRTGCRTSLAL